MDDVPPKDTEILALIGTGISPTKLIQKLCDEGHPQENVIEALQRAIEREKITIDTIDGKSMVVSVRQLAHAA